MNIKMLKAAVVSLVLSVSSLANAGIITYEMEFTVQENSSNSFGGVSVGSIITALVDVDDSFGTNEFYDSTTNADLSFMLNGVDLSTSSFDSINYSGFGTFFNEVAPFFTTPNALFNDVLFVMNSTTDDRSLSISAAAPGNINWSATDTSGFGLSGTFLVHEIATVVQSVPEPATIAVFALGLIGLASRKVKKS